MIGDFEYLVLAGVNRPASVGALYTTLDRLEKKGFVSTWLGEATQSRGGRSKRMVALTEEGVRAASEFYGSISQASQDISWSTR